MRKCCHTAVSGKYVGFASDLTNLGKLCAAKPLHNTVLTVPVLTEYGTTVRSTPYSVLACILHCTGM
jgi:hypothetical protein